MKTVRLLPFFLLHQVKQLNTSLSFQTNRTFPCRWLIFFFFCFPKVLLLVFSMCHSELLLCRWQQPYGRKWRRTKEPLDESERGELKGWLKAQHSENKDHGIWSHHFMANRWGNSGNSGTLYFFGSKITADCDCSHEMKRHLILGRKVMTNLYSI